jgi:RNA polymerase sigma-70 factor (ECF subfamily)
MAQRLARAKWRIKNTRIPFVVPDRHALPGRLPAVLEAVYGCYAIAWPQASDVGSLAAEAQYPAVTLAALLDTEPEAWALAALVTLSLARARPAHLPYLPLDEQDPATWDAALIAEGEAYLRRAGGTATPGRFYLEAAIQAVHCDRARTGVTDWEALHTLYAALVRVAPSLGARVAHAAVAGRLKGPGPGPALLDQIADGAAGFQPLHAAWADLLTRAGRHDAARAAYDRAIALTQGFDVGVVVVGVVAGAGGAAGGAGLGDPLPGRGVGVGLGDRPAGRFGDQVGRQAEVGELGGGAALTCWLVSQSRMPADPAASRINPAHAVLDRGPLLQG